MNTTLLQQTRTVLRAQHKSNKTEQAYTDWIYRFLLFHQKKSPNRFTEKEVKTFLHFLATKRKVAAATQNQALQAVVFFYKNVLAIPLPSIAHLRAHKATPHRHAPTPADVAAILNELKGEARLMASLLYGCGLRLHECVSLRVKNIDLAQNRLFITDDPERSITIPESLKPTLSKRLQLLQLRYEQWLQDAVPHIPKAESCMRKRAGATTSWEQYYLFPADRVAFDAVLGKPVWHHRSNSFLEKAIRQAAKNTLSKTVNCQSLRAGFAVHLLEAGHNLQTVQHLLGHCSIRATRAYARLVKQPVVHSPLDALSKSSDL